MPRIRRTRRMDTAPRAPVLFGGKYYQAIKQLFGSALIGYWPLSEGPAGNAYLTFNGSTSKIDCGSGASLDDLQDNAFTADGWFNSASSANVQNLFNKRAASGSGWYFRVEANGTLTGFIDCATTDAISQSTGIVLNDGEWHHVAMTFDDAGTRRIRLFVDGDEVTYGANTAGVGAISSDAGNNLRLGCRENSNETLNGSLGWCRVSNNLRYTANFEAPSKTTVPTVDANTVSLWPMNEGYGSLVGDLGTNGNDGTITAGDWGAYPAAVDYSGQGNHGTFAGCTLVNGALPAKIGGYAPFFDGVNDLVNIYSADLNTDFDETEGGLIVWGKVNGSGVWTDNTERRLVSLAVDANNYIYIRRSTTNGQIELTYAADGTAETISKGSLSTTDWFMAALTWSVTNNRVIAYWNGAAEGTPQTIAGTWAGALAAALCAIGSTGSTPATPWYGWEGHGMLLNAEPSAASILKAYNLGV